MKQAENSQKRTKEKRFANELCKNPSAFALAEATAGGCRQKVSSIDNSNKNNNNKDIRTLQISLKNLNANSQIHWGKLPLIFTCKQRAGKILTRFLPFYSHPSPWTCTFMSSSTHILSNSHIKSKCLFTLDKSLTRGVLHLESSRMLKYVIQRGVCGIIFPIRPKRPCSNICLVWTRIYFTSTNTRNFRNSLRVDNRIVYVSRKGKTTHGTKATNCCFSRNSLLLYKYSLFDTLYLTKSKYIEYTETVLLSRMVSIFVYSLIMWRHTHNHTYSQCTKSLNIYRKKSCQEKSVC